MLRRVLLAVVVTGVVLGVGAPPVHAHGAHGGTTSDYRVEVTALDVPARSVEIEVLELGDRLQLRRIAAREVIVLGYQGEPYLKLDASGVHENVLSPAAYQNRDRFARTVPPPTVDATAPPRWELRSAGSTVRWHDHRVHWMAQIPPAFVDADPEREHVVIPEGVVPFFVDGTPASLTVRVTWVPSPPRALWLAAVVIAALAGGVLLARVDRVLAAALAAVAAAAAFVATGVATRSHLLLSCALLAVAAAASVVRRPDAVAFAAACTAGLALTRLELFAHPLLRGPLPSTWMRACLAVCLGCAGAAALAGLVGAFRPTRPAVVAPVGQPTMADHG